jgi:hypothetical protein
MTRIELVSHSDGKFDIDELHNAILAIERYSQEEYIIVRLISPKEVKDIQGTVQFFKNFCEHRIAKIEGHIH